MIILGRSGHHFGTLGAATGSKGRPLGAQFDLFIKFKSIGSPGGAHWEALWRQLAHFFVLLVSNSLTNSLTCLLGRFRRLRNLKK